MTRCRPPRWRSAGSLSGEQPAYPAHPEQLGLGGTLTVTLSSFTDLEIGKEVNAASAWPYNDGCAFFQH